MTEATGWEQTSYSHLTHPHALPHDIIILFNIIELRFQHHAHPSPPFASIIPQSSSGNSEHLSEFTSGSHSRVHSSTVCSSSYIVHVSVRCVIYIYVLIVGTVYSLIYWHALCILYHCVVSKSLRGRKVPVPGQVKRCVSDHSVASLKYIQNHYCVVSFMHPEKTEIIIVYHPSCL